MNANRLSEHPVLPIPLRDEIVFYWKKKPFKAKRDEMISSALIANGVFVFGHHPRDGAPQGIFCANGQCSKCMVIANGRPVKSCMTPVRENMIVEPVDGLPELPLETTVPELADIPEHKTDVLIIGGGPAGLSAALEIAGQGIDCLIVDDKHKPGGKLVLQTHKFFGSVEDSYAGTRGITIGENLAEAVHNNPHCTVWLNSTALFVFKDKKVGVLKGNAYHLIQPKVVLNTAGAREKFLRFTGNTLPGVYGAGAFQTLVNRDLVRSSGRLFIVGGGNVGLIAGYHALQAGIQVVGLVEAMPHCGGYKVHADKLKRLGVPIYTSHSVLSANGAERVESVTIAKVDDQFRPIQGTERTFACDTLLIAVGLQSIDEFAHEAEIAGISVYSAGDAAEIAEASSAMFNGKITGLRIANDLNSAGNAIPDAWVEKAEILKSEPGKIVEQNVPESEEGVMPIIHCIQEIPCNPCSTVCPTHSIVLQGDPIMGIPEYHGACTGCGKCVAICPGLAITLVDYRKNASHPLVTIPFEFLEASIKPGDVVPVVDIDGNFLADLPVTAVVRNKQTNTRLVRVRAPKNIAKKIVAFRIQKPEVTAPGKTLIPESDPDDVKVCLCERVSAGEVRALIRKGVRDMNQIKAITRAGMGSCGGKSCDVLIRQIFRSEGVRPEEITGGVRRPLFVEVPLKTFACKPEEEVGDE